MQVGGVVDNLADNGSVYCKCVVVVFDNFRQRSEVARGPTPTVAPQGNAGTMATETGGEGPAFTAWYRLASRSAPSDEVTVKRIFHNVGMLLAQLQILLQFLLFDSDCDDYYYYLAS